MAVPGINVALSLTAGGFLGAINKSIGGLKKMMKAMSLAGKVTAALGLTIGVLGAIHLKNSLKEAIKFQTQIAGLAKVMGSFDEANLIARNIGRLSTELPVASAAMFEVAETAARLGIRGTKNIVEFTKVASKMGVATNLSAELAADAFARILKQTNTAVSEFGVLASVVNELSNNMATTTKEIVDSVRRSAPDLSRLGFTANEIAAIAASLNEVSESASRAGTRLRRFAQDLTDTRKIEAFGKALGISGDEFRQLFRDDPKGTLFRIIDVVREAGFKSDELSTALDTQVRLLLSGMSANRAGLERAFKIVAEQLETPDSLDKEVAIFADTVASKMILVQNAAEVMQRKTGAALARMAASFQDLRLKAVLALDEILHGKLTEFDFLTLDSEIVDNFRDALREVVAEKVAEANKDRDKFSFQRIDFELDLTEDMVDKMETAFAVGLAELGMFEDEAIEIFTNVIPDAIGETGVRLEGVFNAGTGRALKVLGVLKEITLSMDPDNAEDMARTTEALTSIMDLFAKVKTDGTSFETALMQAKGIQRLTAAENEGIAVGAERADLLKIQEERARELTDKYTRMRIELGKSDLWLALHVDTVIDAHGETDKLTRSIRRWFAALDEEEAQKEATKRLEEMREALEKATEAWAEGDIEIRRNIDLLNARKPGEEQAIARQHEMADAMADANKNLGMFGFFSGLARIALMAEEDAAEDNREAWDKRAAAIKKALEQDAKQKEAFQDKIDDLKLLTKASQFEFLVQSLERVGDAAVDAFEAIVTGSGNAGDAVVSMIQQIAREILKRMIVAQLLGLLDGFNDPTPSAGGGRGTTSRTRAFTSRARGGSLNAGQISVVGERGAELFVPRTAGTIVPNDRLGGNTETFVINNYWTVQAMDGASVRSMLVREKEVIQSITLSGVSRSRALKKSGVF